MAKVYTKANPESYSLPTRLASHLEQNPAELAARMQAGGRAIISRREMREQLDVNPIGRYPDILELYQQNIELQRKIAIAKRNKKPLPSIEVTDKNKDGVLEVAPAAELPSKSPIVPEKGAV